MNFMDEQFADQISANQKQIDAKIDDIFRTHNTELVTKFGCYSAESVKAFQQITSRGGKRLRGSLLIQSYGMFGGKNLDVAITAAAAIELIHTYLLIIDDFCDQSDIRRNGPSAHKYLSYLHKASKLQGDSDHFGSSIAINSAIYGMHVASNIILSLDVPSDIRISAHKNINDNLLVTAHGQINDIYNEVLIDVDEKMIRNVLEWKTGYYTFLNPLQIGAILAEADIDSIDSLTDIALGLGTAFQLQDDILGLFGNNAKTGKSNMDDLREGKMTLIIKNTFDRSNAKDKAIIKNALGNQQINQKDLEQVQMIVKKTKVIDELRVEIDRAIDSSITLLHELNNTNKQHRDFIINIAKYIGTRES